MHGTGHRKGRHESAGCGQGIVGLGRLNVPENQPDLLKVWDGIAVDQQGRSISIQVDIAQDLVDKIVQMLNGRIL